MRRDVHTPRVTVVGLARRLESEGKRIVMIEDETAALRWDVINQLVDALGPEMFEDLCATFYSDSPPLFEAIREGMAANDAGAIRRAAHQLKSTTATLGAEALARVFREIETIAAAATDAAALGPVGPLLERGEVGYLAMKHALDQRAR